MGWEPGSSGTLCVLVGQAHLDLLVGRDQRTNQVLRLLRWICRQLLQLLPVTLKRRLQLLVLLLQLNHLSLCIVLLLFALFELGLSIFDLFLDVCEEQILIQRVNLTYIILILLRVAASKLRVSQVYVTAELPIVLLLLLLLLC